MSEFSSQRKLYLFAAACFAIGAVLAIVQSKWNALVVFTVLLLMMLWIQWRVDKLLAERRPEELAADRSKRDERARQRQQAQGRRKP